MDAVAAAAFTLAGIIVGAILSAGLDEWRSRASEKRASKRAVGDNLARWHLDRLTQTRRHLEGTVVTLEAIATGSVEEIHRGQALSRANPEGNLALVGDIGLQREVHDLFVDLSMRAGRGLEPDHLVRRVDVMGRVSVAIDAQEQRVLKGKEPLRVSRDDAPELFDAYRIAARIDQYAMPAGINARIAMWVLRRWFRRHVGTG